MTETRHDFSAVEDRLRLIEECDSIEALKLALLKIIQPLGFHGFNHVDTGRPDQVVPLFFGSFLPEWGNCYVAQNFGAVDPTLLLARRSNLPFRWTDIPLPKKTQGPTSGAHATFNAAFDFGYEQGVVYPWHSRDRLGRPCSALTVLLWRDNRRRFDPLWQEQRHALQITMLYWQDKAAQFLWPSGQSGVPMLDEDGELLNAPRLTDRERDVLAWAARGKTVGVTAEILGIATDTAENHIRAAMRKLGATNKTHGVARAIHLGFIDP